VEVGTSEVDVDVDVDRRDATVVCFSDPHPALTTISTAATTNTLRMDPPQTLVGHWSDTLPTVRHVRGIGLIGAISVARPGPGDDADPVGSTEEIDELIAELAIPHRARKAYWRLLVTGRDALDAIRQALAHPNPDVRFYCTLAMDHLADSDSFGTLVGLLDDASPRVRLHALHALACDRCKADDVCTPPKDDVLQPALRALRTDPSPHVRAMAVEVVGRWVHTDSGAERALVDAQRDDASPAVRKKAGWYAPGGPIFRRTTPKSARTRRPSAVGS
jgi:hypothetical protein